MSNSRGPMLGLLLLYFLGSLVHSSSATDHKVSWTIPSSGTFYDDLAATQVFHVGDTIEFDYEVGMHNVLAVSPKDATACDTSNPIQQWDAANPKVSLDIPGKISFICGFALHCSMGMKVTLTVLPLAPVPTPPAPQLPPPTKPPTTPATPELPSPPPKRPSNPSPEPTLPAPTSAPIPSPPKKKKTKNSLAPASAPLSPASPLSAVDPNLAPAPLPETAGASVVRSTALVIAATLLVSCYAILL